MTLRYYANAAATALSLGISDAVLSMTVDSVTGLPLTFPYTLIIDRGTSSEEVVEVTASSGTTLTITRGVDDTTAFAHDTGASVVHGVSARDIREPNEHINSNSGVHGVTGNVVGDSDSQALTNKDLTSSTNSFPSTLATLSTSQVLTNKDLSSDTNNFPSNLVRNTATSLFPVGGLIPYAGSTAPTGWLICNGAAVSRTDYASLFSALGTTYGAGDGSSTFNLPDLRDRAPVGVSGTKTRGATGGADSVTIATAHLPAHTHSINHDHGAVATTSDTHSHTFTYEADGDAASGSSWRVKDISFQTPGAGANYTGSTTSDTHNHTVDVPSFSGTSGSTGSGSALTVQNPYTAVNYIIRAV